MEHGQSVNPLLDQHYQEGALVFHEYNRTLQEIAGDLCLMNGTPISLDHNVARILAQSGSGAEGISPEWAMAISQLSKTESNPNPICITDGKKNHLKTGISVKYLAKNLPKAPSGVGKCISGCDYWMAFDTELFIKDQNKLGWYHFPKVFAGITGNRAHKLQGIVLVEENTIKLQHFLAIGPLGAFYLQTKQINPQAKAPTWKNVLTLSKDFCIPCHQNDGFDQIKGFTDRKEEILPRILFENKESVTSMPPWETRYGKFFSKKNRMLMAEWLDTQEATISPYSVGVITQPIDQNDNQPIAEPLKALAEANCTRCHADSNKQGWWRGKKDEIKSRIESGNMPKDKTLSTMQRDKLINAFDDL